MLSLLIDMIRNRYKILKCNFRLSVEDNDYEVVYGKLLWMELKDISDSFEVDIETGKRKYFIKML